MKNINIGGLDSALIARLILSIIAVFNMGATYFGWNPLDVEDSNVYALVSFAFLIVMFVRGFWKNNNFTEAAQISQEVLDALKAGKMEITDIEEDKE